MLNSFDEFRREQLAEGLGKLADASAKRQNPFYVGLDDSEERQTIEQLSRQAASTFTAAAALCAGRWQSAEGDMRVRPVHACTAGFPCVSLNQKPSLDEAERRARFLAWPLGYAIVLSVATPKQVDRVADALRGTDSSHIALVLTSRELHGLRSSPSLGRILDAARRLGTSPRAKAWLALAAIARVATTPAARDEVPWLDLPRDSILVVPRLGALASSDALVADVRERLASCSAQVEWLATPIR